MISMRCDLSLDRLYPVLIAIPRRTVHSTEMHGYHIPAKVNYEYTACFSCSPEQN